MQTLNLINDSFSKRKNFTLSHLDEMIEGEMIVENKLKSMLLAMLLGTTPSTSTYADTSNTMSPTNMIDYKEVESHFKLIDRAVLVTQKILDNKKPNPKFINDIKTNVSVDMNRLIGDSFRNKLSTLDTQKYLSLLMSAYGFTDKDEEYIKIKSIIDGLQVHIKKILDSENKLSNLDKMNNVKGYELWFYNNLASKL